MKNVETILWAIDAGEPLDARYSAMTKTLRELTARGNTRVVPVCVAKTHDAANGVRAWLARQELPRLQELILLRPGSLTPDTIAESLATTAREERAGLIALATHGRRGPARWIFGSVSETMIQQWKIPALVLNPEHDAGRPIGRLLFPTDFSPFSRAAFDLAVRWASESGATIVLYHVRNLMPRDAETHAAEWSDWAERSHGVNVSIRLEESASAAADGICAAARELGCGLIVMASAAGALRAALVGSVTRDVIAGADCPVLAWHPPEEAVEQETLSRRSHLFPAPVTLLSMIAAALIALPVPSAEKKTDDDGYTKALTILTRNCAICHQAADHPGALFLNKRNLSETKTLDLMIRLIETSQMPPQHAKFKTTADGKELLAWLKAERARRK